MRHSKRRGRHPGEQVRPLEVDRIPILPGTGEAGNQLRREQGESSCQF